ERAPRARLTILEKEADIAQHQTGHNSGVIHSGIYYKPGSHKARLCVEGARLMKAYCDKSGIPVETCGKVIVATSQDEVPRLKTLYERGVANGVPGVSMIDAARLTEIEPHARALAGIHSPQTAIVDYRRVAETLAKELTGSGLTLERNFRVASIARSRGEVRLGAADSRVVTATYLVNCAGLHSDTVARLAGAAVDVQIVPFRGEYYMLRPERRSLVNGLIYPVPDPEFPFLGVHFTRTVHGALVDDFRIVQSADAVHVLNAPSPAATASLAIGRHIATIAAQTFTLPS